MVSLNFWSKLFYSIEVEWQVKQTFIEAMSIIKKSNCIYVMRCAIWYHLYNFKNVKSIHGEVLILVKLQALACKFIKINTPPWMFFAFFKLYKWYQIAQAPHILKFLVEVYSIDNSMIYFLKICEKEHCFLNQYLC